MIYKNNYNLSVEFTATFPLFSFQYAETSIGNFAQPDSVNSSMTDGTHVSLQPQLDATFTSQTTKTARKINTSEYQVRHRYLERKKPLKFCSLFALEEPFSTLNL